jgi:hypothetical protein
MYLFIRNSVEYKGYVLLVYWVIEQLIGHPPHEKALLLADKIH